MTHQNDDRAIEIQIRAAGDPASREVEGIAVPWETTIDINGQPERFDAACVMDNADRALLLWRHSAPIGRIIENTSTADGWQIRAHISETPTGNEVYTLVRDGVIDRFSVGFRPLESRTETDGTIVYTRVRVSEVSLVPFPAYDTATVTKVRHNTPNTIEEIHTMTDPIIDTEARALATEARDSATELERRFAVFSTPSPEPVIDRRSAAEVLKSLVAGDDSAVRSYNETLERAYTGGTTADAGLVNGWVGDLTRIFDTTSGALGSVFSTGTLPAAGMTLEYAELASNTIAVAQQLAEGDDLGLGKVSLVLKTAPIKTYGGVTTLTRQEIERSSLPILQHSLNALARAAGKRSKLELRTAFTALKTAREALAADAGVVALGANLGASTWSQWIGATVDAASALEAEDLTLDALIVSPAVFKKFATITASDGRPLLLMDGTGTNNIGTINPRALGGQIAGLTVVTDSGLTGNSASFANSLALRAYNSPLVSLQDETILNLSKNFGVYRYGAVAAEIPAGLVPVKFSA